MLIMSLDAINIVFTLDNSFLLIKSRSIRMDIFAERSLTKIFKNGGVTLAIPAPFSLVTSLASLLRLYCVLFRQIASLF